MNDNPGLKRAVDALADAAEAAREAVAELKALAIRLWVNSDQFALDDPEVIVRRVVHARPAIERQMQGCRSIS